jgi:hypothetical protein
MRRQYCLNPEQEQQDAGEYFKRDEDAGNWRFSAQISISHSAQGDDRQI